MVTEKIKNWSTRYYLCSASGAAAFRLPSTLHRALVARKIALREFANTKQKLLEVFIGKTEGEPVVLEARGSIYSFGSDGLLDLQAPVEVMANIVEGASSRRASHKVIDIGPAVRRRRWIAEQTWQPSRQLLSAIRNDLKGTARVPKLAERSGRRR